MTCKKHDSKYLVTQVGTWQKAFCDCELGQMAKAGYEDAVSIHLDKPNPYPGLIPTSDCISDDIKAYKEEKLRTADEEYDMRQAMENQQYIDRSCE